MSDPPSPERSGKHIWDVLLVQEYPGTRRCNWTGGQYILSDSDLWVGKYDHTISLRPKSPVAPPSRRCVHGRDASATEVLRGTQRIMIACEPAGYSRDPDNEAGGLTRQLNRTFGTCYVLVCTNPSQPDEFNWDPDQRILRCVVFSRLVHPTAIGFKYAARLRFDEDGEISTVEPSPWHAAYTVSDVDKLQQRHWLEEGEWTNVSKLLSRWPISAAKSLPRINRALRYFEKTARERDLVDRYELLVRTAEILWGEPFEEDKIADKDKTNAKGKRSRKSNQGRGARFKSGLSCLAYEFGIEVSKEQADRAWNFRSRVTHGVELPQPPAREAPNAIVSPDAFDMFEPYRKVEEVVRMTIRRAIEDDDFAARFESKERIASWLTNAVGN